MSLWPFALRIGGALIVLISRLPGIPRTAWDLREYDSVGGVLDIGDPTVYAAMGKAIYFFAGSPLTSLVTVNLAASVAGFLILAYGLRSLTGDEHVAAAAALLFWMTPAAIVFGSVFSSETAAMLALSAVVAGWARLSSSASAEAAIWTGAALGMTSALMPNATPAVLIAAIVIVLISDAPLQIRVWAPAACLVVVVAAGGGLPRGFEIGDVAALKQAAIRFLVHPLGGKWTAGPVLALALLGAWRVAVRLRALAPVIAISAVSGLMAIGRSYVENDVGPGLAVALATAVAAAFGLAAIRDRVHIPLVVTAAAALAIASLIYVLPVLKRRASEEAPLVRAAETARAKREGLLLYDTQSSVPAEILLFDRPRLHIDAAMRMFADRPDVPLTLYASGTPSIPSRTTMTVSAGKSDAERKLLGFRPYTAIVDPIVPGERFLPLEGVYPHERAEAEHGWWWLAPAARIRVPRGEGAVAFTFRVPPHAPYRSIDVRLTSSGEDRTVTVRRDPMNTASVMMVVSTAGGEVLLQSSDSFEDTDGSQRTLSVQLLGIQRVAGVQLRPAGEQLPREREVFRQVGSSAAK